MDASAALQQLAVPQDSQQNNVCGDRLHEETGQHPPAQEGRLLIGTAGKAGLATTTRVAGRRGYTPAERRRRLPAHSTVSPPSTFQTQRSQHSRCRPLNCTLYSSC